MPVDPWGGYTQSIDRLGQASRSKQRGQELRSLQDYRSQSMGLQQQRMNAEGKDRMNKFLGAVLKGVDSQEKLVYAAGLYYNQFPNEKGKNLFPAEWNKESEQWANSYVNAYGDPDKPKTPKYETYYDSKGTPHTIDSNAEKPDPSWSDTRPLKPEKSKERFEWEEETRAKHRGGWDITIPTDEGDISIKQGIPQSKKNLEKALNNLQTMQTSTFDLIDTSSKIMSSVGNNPELIGAAGWTQRTINSIGQQLEGFVKSVLPEGKIKANLNPQKYDFEKFSGDAVKSATIKSRIVKLAYMIARIREPDARQFSDADIQRAIDEIGGGTGSTQQMAAVMRTIQMDAISSLNRRYQSTLKKPFRPNGLSEETIQYGKENGLSEEEIILRHIQKYGMQ